MSGGNTHWDPISQVFSASGCPSRSLLPLTLTLSPRKCGERGYAHLSHAAATGYKPRMEITTHTFDTNASGALRDAELQRALSGLKGGLVAQRRTAYERLPEFEALRDVGRDIRDHALANLDLYLEIYEQRATAAPVGLRTEGCGPQQKPPPGRAKRGTDCSSVSTWSSLATSLWNQYKLTFVPDAEAPY